MIKACQLQFHLSLRADVITKPWKVLTFFCKIHRETMNNLKQRL